MEPDFDPYRKWLGIPPEEQPPNHYRLLGIALFEDDPDVISGAADRQMAHVRTFQTGRHASLSQAMLNELSSAKLCLLQRDRKRHYDDELRIRLTGMSPTAVSAHSAHPATAAFAAGSPAVAIPRPPAAGLPRPLPMTPLAVPVVPLWPAATAAYDPAPMLPPRTDTASPLTAVAEADAASETAAPSDPIGPRIRSTRSKSRRRSSQSPVVAGTVAVGLILLLIIFALSGMFDGGAASDHESRGGGVRGPASKPPRDGGSRDGGSRDSGPAPGVQGKPTGRDSGTARDASSPSISDSARPKTDRAASDARPAVVPPKDKPPSDTKSPPKKPPSDQPPSDQPPSDQPPPDKPPIDRPPKDATPDAPPSIKPNAAADKSDPPKPSQPAIGGKKKPAPPIKLAVDKAADKVRGEFRQQFVEAKTVDQRIALAKQLVDKARATADDPIARYALLVVSRDYSVQVLNNAEQFFAVVDAMAESFEVDPVDLKRRCLEEVGGLALKPQQFKDLLPHAARLAQQESAAERFDAAVAVARTAKAIAKKTRDALDLQQADDLLSEVADAEKEHRAFVRSRPQVEAGTADAVAKLAVGRYYCVVRRDWQAGLPLMAAGSDAKLKSLAEKDLANPKDAKAQTDLADDWMATGKRKAGIYRQPLLHRARHWYARAAETAPPAEQAKLEAKIQEIDATVGPPAAPTAEKSTAEPAKPS